MWICYNRTGVFLVAGIYLIEYDREFVILLVNLLVRLTVFRLLSINSSNMILHFRANISY